MSDLDDPRGLWASAIGRAFVAFGSIEYITILCLQEIPKDRIKRSTSSFKLVQRIDLIQELLEAYDGDIYQELSTNLGIAKGMAPTRNLIAHNPLFVDIYQKSDGSFHPVQSIIGLKNSKQRISLLETQDFADKAEKLVIELYASATKVLDMFRSGTGT